MSSHLLENEALRLCVADAGAELCSVLDKASGAERLWTADPSVWNRHSPILFPFVGRVTDGKYRIGGQEYTMKTQHGFARDMDFACVEETASSVTHRLLPTEATREIYPYEFCLTVKHTLDAENPRLLHIDWLVENRGDEPMYYSIGGHPGFLMPEGIRKEDCSIVFPGRDHLTYFSANAAGFALPEQMHSLSLQDGAAPYQADIPDTWIFSGGQVGSVGIALPDGTPCVTVFCEQFPLLAVWANPKGPFICLEPWFGRTDDAGFTGTLAEKPGMELLSPGESKAISYRIEFHAV